MAEEHTADFAELLRRARRDSGLSQEELAERAGLSARAISALERGVNRAPRPDTLDMLADALALTPNERQRWQRLRRQQASRQGAVAADRVEARPTIPDNLPHQPTRFFGRETELAGLTQMLHEAGTQLVTLTGPGGSGKTRLALQLAASLIAEYPDGVYFVDLAPVSDHDRVIPTLGTVLGVWPRTDQPIVTTVAEWLTGKRLLLVLDNLEQVLAVAPELGTLLGQCPAIQVVATSRAPLRLRAEREFPVLPLPVIDAVALAASAESDAVRLFFDRARSVRPDLDASAELVAQICQQLDGLPLAIELAAASVRLFPPKAMLARLEHHLPLPAANQRDAPARQRTLHDTIAWSYDLLSPDTQRLFRHLSIFKGGWLLDAAEAVSGGEDGMAADRVLQETETLIEHSLIQSHEWLDDSPRFTMLETIREFGLQQLGASGELDLIQHRLASFLLELNAGAAEQLRSPQFKHWLERGDAEIENVRLSLDWATTHDPELALRLAREIGWYLLTRGGFIEARQRLQQVFERADNIPDDLRAEALLDRAMHATTALNFETATEDVEAALTLYRQLGDEHGIAECVHELGRIAIWSNDYERAKPLFEDALVRFRAFDASTLTVCCVNLSAALLYLGELDEAAAVLAEGLAYGERFGDVWALVLIVGGMADIERGRGELARARELTRRTFGLLRELQDPRYIAQSAVAAACLAIEEEADDHAARLLGAVSELRRAIGLPPETNDEPDYDRLVPIARARLGDERWNDAWQSGQTLSQSEVIELVLDWLAGDA